MVESLTLSQAAAVAGTVAQPRGTARVVLPVLAAATAASVLSMLSARLGLMDMPLLPGCGGGMLPASIGMALRLAAVMTAVGLVIPRPSLLRSTRGLMILTVWLLGLAAFSLLDMQMAAMAFVWPDPAAALLLRSAPLAAGLLVAAFVPKGARSCAAIMVVMTHAGLMAWPWMAACAALTAWQEALLRRRTGQNGRHSSACGLGHGGHSPLSVSTPSA